MLVKDSLATIHGIKHRIMTNIFTTALFDAVIRIESSATIFTTVLFEAMIEIESLARIFTTVLFEVMIEIR